MSSQAEGVVVRHRKVEFALRLSVAFDLEMHGAKLACCVVGLLWVDPMYWIHGREGKKCTDQLDFHARLLVFRTGRCRRVRVDDLALN